MRQMALSVGCLLFLAASASSGRAHAESARVRREPNVPLLATGAVLLAGTYTVTKTWAFLSALEENRELRLRQRAFYVWQSVPIAGPWISLTQVDEPNATRNTVIAVASGTLQTVGAALLVAGFVLRRERPVPAAPTTTVRVGIGGGAMFVHGEF